MVENAAVAQVILRAVTTRDLPVLFAHQGDPESVAMAGVPARDRPAFDQHWRTILGDPRVVPRTIVLPAGDIAGYLTSWIVDGRRMIGYWLGREHWGRGIASAALGLYLGELTDRPLHAIVSAHNVASRRVLEKHGFVVEEQRAGAGGEADEADEADEVRMVLRAD